MPKKYARHRLGARQIFVKCKNEQIKLNKFFIWVLTCAKTNLSLPVVYVVFDGHQSRFLCFKFNVRLTIQRFAFAGERPSCLNAGNKDKSVKVRSS